MAFVPPALPPSPPIDLSNQYHQIDQATASLARLDASTQLLPDIDFFIYMYVRKEAVLSSQIEGTQSSLSDLLLFESNEIPEAPIDDVQEVSNYVASLNHAIERIQSGVPTCVRVLREAHEVLLSTGRGSETGPGEIRTTQNWLGGSHPSNATFVPPPPDKLDELLTNLEWFIHDEDEVQLPILVRAALAHVQFETIHPFRDGNGRIGRLLIALILVEKGLLERPILYLSLFFKTHRTAYYEKLMRVRTNGEWEQWIDFFLKGVIETAEQATNAVTDLLELFASDREKIQSLGRVAGSVLRVHEYLQNRLILSVPQVAESLKLSQPTIRSAIRHLEEMDIVHEVTGRERGRLYIYTSYFAIMRAGTEPLSDDQKNE